VLFVFGSILVIGTLAERLWESWRWLVLYIVSGFSGELAGYAWQPFGAGASVAGCGLLASIGVWLICKNKTRLAQFCGAFILFGAVALICLRDIHGVPILVEAGLGYGLRRVALSPLDILLERD
jgi:rhomboid protease GluP